MTRRRKRRRVSACGLRSTARAALAQHAQRGDGQDDGDDEDDRRAR